MDIAAWLHSVRNPDEGDSIVLPQAQAYQVPIRNPSAFKSHRYREIKSRDDSSLLVPAAPEDERLRSPRRDRKQVRRENDLESPSSPSHEYIASGTSSSESEPEETFERRKRHKTREEIYEPGANARKRRRTRNASTKRSKKKERTYRRTVKAHKPHNTGHEMLSNFQADNVPSQRLTLRPHRSVGLFCNGKASSPKRGQGRECSKDKTIFTKSLADAGLTVPDLTFSAMKFLQQYRHEPSLQEKFQSDKLKPFRQQATQDKSRDHERGDAYQSGHDSPDTLTNRIQGGEFHHVPSSHQGTRKPLSPIDPRSGAAINSSHRQRNQVEERSASALSWQASNRGITDEPPLLRSRTAISVGKLPYMKSEARSQTQSSSTGARLGHLQNSVATGRENGELQLDGSNSRGQIYQESNLTHEDISVRDQAYDHAEHSPPNQARSSSPLKKALKACDAAVTRDNVNRADRQQDMFIGEQPIRHPRSTEPSHHYMHRKQAASPSTSPVPRWVQGHEGSRQRFPEALPANDEYYDYQAGITERRLRSMYGWPREEVALDEHYLIDRQQLQIPYHSNHMAYDFDTVHGYDRNGGLMMDGNGNTLTAYGLQDEHTFHTQPYIYDDAFLAYEEGLYEPGLPENADDGDVSEFVQLQPGETGLERDGWNDHYAESTRDGTAPLDFWRPNKLY